MRDTKDEIAVPILDDVLAVERRLLLQEELRIRKNRTTERHSDDVVLRAQEA